MTIEAIYNRMTEAFISDPVVIAKYELVEGKTFNEQFSAVSIERIMFYDIASSMFFNYQAFDQHAIDVNNILSQKRAHTPNWYAGMAVKFQYGYDLVEDTDTYDNSGLTEEQINDSRIVKFAAAVPSINKSILYIKVATGSNEAKKPLSENELTAFKAYIEHIQDAGVHIEIINAPADEMYIEMDVYFNPLILDKQGKRLDGSSDTPVQEVVKKYIHNLLFNGLYTNAKLIDMVQTVHGVEFPELKIAASRYGLYVDFKEIDAKEKAHAGYYTIKDENLRLRFLPYDQ
ncbi:hypothetical protein [Dysgonomonas sp. ZJ279]|uniref:hypothetical protein n=1 Tax=Dysgonomonas sp. ZJ279 TaxID=2709796 RepID=UPI0013EBB976|nr:hypothetical protein [Dysgonomonas sp. ZJ279]